MHAHRNNTRRYRRLLETHTDAERDYIELRLSEERAVLRDYIERRLSAACRPASIAIHRSASVRLVDVLLKFPYLAKMR
jgi:hypothetical protein